MGGATLELSTETGLIRSCADSHTRLPRHPQLGTAAAPRLSPAPRSVAAARVLTLPTSPRTPPPHVLPSVRIHIPFSWALFSTAGRLSGELTFSNTYTLHSVTGHAVLLALSILGYKLKFFNHVYTKYLESTNSCCQCIYTVYFSKERAVRRAESIFWV